MGNLVTYLPEEQERAFRVAAAATKLGPSGLMQALLEKHLTQCVDTLKAEAKKGAPRPRRPRSPHKG